MGTIKIEFDIPNFEKELNINLTIRKDGEVVYTTSQPDGLLCETEKKEKKTTSTKKSSQTVSGNLMDMTF